MPILYQTEKLQEKELPNYLPPIPKPFIPIEDLKAISKESGISFEALVNAPVTDAEVEKITEKKSRKFSGFLFLLKAISIPYILTGLLIFIGFQVRAKKNTMYAAEK
jgi:hypothetical protein